MAPSWDVNLGSPCLKRGNAFLFHKIMPPTRLLSFPLDVILLHGQESLLAQDLATGKTSAALQSEEQSTLTQKLCNPRGPDSPLDTAC